MEPHSDDLTSVHVRRAVGGDGTSTGWLVERLTPALAMQAAYRLRGPLASWCDPADLVQDVWAIALPRLPDLVARDGRLTPVLVRFLSTVLLNRVTRLLEDYLRAGRPMRDSSRAAPGPVEPAAPSHDGVSQAVHRGELQQAVRDAIESLDEKDRDVVVLRGIEQLSNNRVAAALGVQPSSVSERYHKALDKLRRLLPGSVFDELADDPER